MTVLGSSAGTMEKAFNNVAQEHSSDPSNGQNRFSQNRFSQQQQQQHYRKLQEEDGDVEEQDDASCVDSGDVIICSRATTFNVNGVGATRFETDLICPSDLVESNGGDFVLATQTGECGCDAAVFALADDGISNATIPESLDCFCYLCPTGAVAFTCDSSVLGPCTGFNCEGECNGALDLDAAPEQPPSSVPAPSPAPMMIMADASEETMPPTNITIAAVDRASTAAMTDPITGALAMGLWTLLLLIRS